MNNDRNTLLKIKGSNEWIALYGEQYHLTIHRDRARPFTAVEIALLQPEFETLYQKELEQEEWILLNQKHEA